MSHISWSDFVVWQCSLRQRNFRMFSGKPSEGTTALILDNKSNKEIASLRSVLIEKNSLNTAKMFEFMIKKTHDPEERFSKAVKFFSYDYYNTPRIMFMSIKYIGGLYISYFIILKGNKFYVEKSISKNNKIKEKK